MQEVPVVELEDLKVRLGRREILHGITCRLGVSGTGKAVGLLGPLMPLVAWAAAGLHRLCASRGLVAPPRLAPLGDVNV